MVKKPGSNAQLRKKNNVILRMNSLHSRGITGEALQARINAGKLMKLKPGYYARADRITDMSDNEIAATVMPNGTLYLLSAAALYDLTTVIPDAVYLAVPNTGRTPQLPTYPPIILTTFKPSLFTLGRTSIRLSNGDVPIYSRERTVCDIFKHREEIGMDVALEVIRNYLHGEKDIQTLFRYAKQMRLFSMLKPYVEALV